MEHKYKVGDMVTSLVNECDVTKGDQYKVVEVDHDDDVCPVKLLDGAGDFYWMHATCIEPYAATDTTPDTQYIRILETLSGDDIVEMARNINEALQDAP